MVGLAADAACSVFSILLLNKISVVATSFCTCASCYQQIPVLCSVCELSCRPFCGYRVTLVYRSVSAWDWFDQKLEEWCFCHFLQPAIFSFSYSPFSAYRSFVSFCNDFSLPLLTSSMPALTFFVQCCCWILLLQSLTIGTLNICTQFPTSLRLSHRLFYSHFTLTQNNNNNNLQQLRNAHHYIAIIGAIAL